MAGGGADEPLLQPLLPHDLLGFDAVLVGVLLKVQVMEQAHHGPEVLLLAVTQLFRKPAHNVGDHIGVLQMKVALVILLQQVQGFVVSQ